MQALIVDDDVVSRMALVDLLAGYDMFDLVEAQDGPAALALLGQGLRPTICFCGVRMPGMSGIDLLERIRSAPALAALPFVLVSSASAVARRLKRARAGTSVSWAPLVAPAMP